VLERLYSHLRLNIRGQGTDAASVGAFERVSAIHAWTLGAKAPTWRSARGVLPCFVPRPDVLRNPRVSTALAGKSPHWSRASLVLDSTVAHSSGRPPNHAPNLGRGSMPRLSAAMRAAEHFVRRKVAGPGALTCHGEQRVPADRHVFASRPVAPRPGGKPAPAAEPGRSPCRLPPLPHLKVRPLAASSRHPPRLVPDDPGGLLLDVERCAFGPPCSAPRAVY